MEYLDLLHWSFIAAGLVGAVLTDFIKRVVKLFPKKSWHSIILDGRIVPVAITFGLGWAPGIPLPEIIEPGIGSALYYATAGVVAVWMYGLAEKVFKEYLPEKLKRWFKIDKKEEEQEETE